MDALCAFQLTEALKGAIELDVFTHIAAGAVTPSAIAERANASERGVRILCDYLTVRGFLGKDGSRYSCSPTGSRLPRQAFAVVHRFDRELPRPRSHRQELPQHRRGCA
jgi:DNA-binding IclR family transcriptional regulator